MAMCSCALTYMRMRVSASKFGGLTLLVLSAASLTGLWLWCRSSPRPDCSQKEGPCRTMHLLRDPILVRPVVSRTLHTAFMTCWSKKLQNWDLDPGFFGVLMWSHGWGPPLPSRGSWTTAGQPPSRLGRLGLGRRHGQVAGHCVAQ